MALGAVGLAGGVLALAGCSRSPGGGGKSARVVVYSSIDRQIIEPVLAEFSRVSAAAAAAGTAGGAVFTAELVGDTEATKATGLAQRVLSEKARPRADVWLSSEGVTTAWLAREGVLSALRPPASGGPAAGADALARAIDEWPAEFRSESWISMSLRPRRIVYNTRVMDAARAPRSLDELCREDLRGRVVIARARFGTTRGHVALLHARLGDDGLLALAKRLKAVGVREVDGNATVVRAVARGEAHAGLTDSDDVYAGQREGWPVDATPDPVIADLPQSPTTLALVAGGPNAAGARALAAWLLDGALERSLAGGDWRAIPVLPRVRAELSVTEPVRAAAWDSLDVERALSIWEQGLA